VLAGCGCVLVLGRSGLWMEEGVVVALNSDSGRELVEATLPACEGLEITD
jgi:hypothetical protein